MALTRLYSMYLDANNCLLEQFIFGGSCDKNNMLISSFCSFKIDHVFIVIKACREQVSE